MEQVILKDEMAKRKAPALGTCFMIEPPPPPTSSGQEKPTQRFSRILRFHSCMNSGVRAPSSGRLSSRNATTSLRKASSSSVSWKSMA